MKRKTPESNVLRACLDLLAAEHVWAMRINTGAMKDGRRFIRFGKPGTADILALPWKLNASSDDWGIRPLWIEAKSQKGRQTEEQQAFEAEVSNEGHDYLLVRDVDTLRSWLKAHGCI